MIRPAVRPVLELLGRDLRATALAQAASAGLPHGSPDVSVVRADEIDALPAAVQRYLGFMRVVGAPRVWSFAARFQGRFNLQGRGWMPAEAWQYNCAHPVARIFHMRLDMAGVVPMVGRDTLLDGEGRMVGRLLGLVPVANGTGVEYDVGELTTWLNDALVLAPSMLLSQKVTWDEVDDETFDVALTHGSHTVHARVSLDENGAIRDFSSRDRWAAMPGGLVQAEWTTPFDGWVLAAGHRLPLSGQAIWHLEDGPLTYAEGAFVPGSVAVNLRP